MSADTSATFGGQAGIVAEHVAVINRLGKRIVGDIIEIGRRLTECREIINHGHWGGLHDQFGWSDQTALNFMRVYEMSNSKNFLNLNIPLSTLYLIAAPNTPEELRTEVLCRAKAGESIPVAEVKKAIAGDKVIAKRKTINAKPLPDIVDGCVATVRRRIEDTVLELNRPRAKKCRPELERLFAALADAIADLERKALPAEEETAAEAAKCKALYQAAENGSEAVAALLKVEAAS